MVFKLPRENVVDSNLDIADQSAVCIMRERFKYGRS